MQYAFQLIVALFVIWIEYNLNIILDKGGKIMAEGRCMKCRAQREIKDGKEVVTKNNMRMLKGKCPKCGTTVCKILGKAK